MILVSPWSRGGYICSQVFDHTSIIRFLETWTGVREPNLSSWRRKICGDLTGAFDFAHPDFTLPALPAPEPGSCPDGAKPPVPATPTLPAQEPGRKPARPLPYQLNANAHVDGANGQLWITLRNRTRRPVTFTLKANAHRPDGPWIRVVPAGGESSEIFHPLSHGQGWYDLTVTADCDPRFQRVLAGHIETGQASVTE
jgi:phospholipase C